MSCYLCLSVSLSGLALVCMILRLLGMLHFEPHLGIVTRVPTSSFLPVNCYLFRAFTWSVYNVLSNVFGFVYSMSCPLLECALFPQVLEMCLADLCNFALLFGGVLLTYACAGNWVFGCGAIIVAQSVSFHLQM